jgi:sialate O-acetylesterase
MSQTTKIFSLLVIWHLISQSAFAGIGVKLPYFFSDNMVLQRQKPIRFWGTASPKSAFNIEFAGEKKKIKTEASGKWEASFPAREAGGPYELKVDSDSSFSYKNILIGDVWLCSGQSNMEWTVKQVFNAPYELRNANIPQIRSFTVAREISSDPRSNVARAVWQESTSENTAAFSAVAFFFAKEIFRTQHVPIGIIHTSWGGTAIEPWIGIKSMEQHPDFKELALKYIGENQGNQKIESSQDAYASNMQKWMDSFQKTDPGFTEKWFSGSYVPQDWKTFIAPAYWEDNGLPDFDGIVWLRKEVNVPASMAGKPLLMNLETLKDVDITYFNGTEVGKTSWQPGRRIYVVPGHLVKEGINLVAIRLENPAGLGGFTSRLSSDLRLQELAESDKPLIIPLSGVWLFKNSLAVSMYPAKPADPAENRRKPSVIYNAMIAPFEDLGLKGFLWYQGEANASEAGKYQKLLPLLIADWRKQFKQPDLSFVIAQLSAYGALTPNPTESPWAELREAQLATLAVPKTGLAVTIDVGNPYDVHPVYKQQVGLRMAAEARRICYGENGLQTSPLYESMQVEGKAIRIRFKYAQSGLQARNGNLKGFAIAGSDGKFVWANAKIEEKEVLVWSDQVTEPKVVRYAWANSPVESNGANLYNKEGFPAAPFRTDNPY